MANPNRSASQEPCYEVLWPLSRKAVRATAAAPRIPDLNGKTICELWDVVFRGETIFPLVRDYIKARFSRAKIVEYSEFGNFHGAHERTATAALPEQLRRHGCDAVIVGVGA